MQKDLLAYSKGFKYLHWVVAALVLAMLSGGFFMQDFSSDMKPLVYMMHKSTGLTILALMLIRLVWIVSTGKPKLPHDIPLWERMLANFVQVFLYASLISMAFSGWVMSTASNKIPVYFGLFRVPLPFVDQSDTLAHWMNSTHKTLAWVLVALVSLHILGALKHWLIQKDDVIKRMLP